MPAPNSGEFALLLWQFCCSAATPLQAGEVEGWDAVTGMRAAAADKATLAGWCRRQAQLPTDARMSTQAAARSSHRGHTAAV